MTNPKVDSSAASKIDLRQFNQLLTEQLPLFDLMHMQVDAFSTEQVIIRARCDEQTLRPGRTVAGPVMMGLADAAFYAVVLANIGMVTLAVTTNFCINFLRKPELGDIFCRAEILKLGKRLTVCQGIVYSAALGPDKPVAHVTGTYSIPPA